MALRKTIWSKQEARKGKKRLCSKKARVVVVGSGPCGRGQGLKGG